MNKDKKTPIRAKRFVKIFVAWDSSDRIEEDVNYALEYYSNCKVVSIKHDVKFVESKDDSLHSAVVLFEARKEPFLKSDDYAQLEKEKGYWKQTAEFRSKVIEDLEKQLLAKGIMPCSKTRKEMTGFS